ncbi:NifU family protein [Bradyrhizobium sp. B097]|uniref:NifU family protein n=1 Tax=Bradyrhizobium sp. B097 TaxID=3140244 RepID=UPI0031830CDD
MLAEPEQLRQLSATATGREIRIRAVIEGIRSYLQRDGGDRRLIGVDGCIVSLIGACAFGQRLRGALEGIQARLVDRLGEFVRPIPVAAADKARD